MKNILLVFTGGTIGSTVTHGTINTADGAAFQLLALYDNPHAVHFETLQPVKILSENLAPCVWQTLIAAIEAAPVDAYDGIIVTHGTDTLAYTAAALGFYFAQLNIPLLLVSSDYPLADSRANGLAHFRYAVDYIVANKPAGVFVPYRNAQQELQLHHGARLGCSWQLSGDFFSVKNTGQSHFVPPTLKLTAKLQQFSARILLIKPYPALDYRYFDLSQVDAVVHDLYHSGTACATQQWGEQYSLLAFIKNCTAQHIPVYLAPAFKSEAAYSSTQDLIAQGAVMLWNMSIEAAYIKVLLAHSNFSDAQQRDDFLQCDIAGEHI